MSIKEIKVFDNTIGLNNVVSPQHLLADAENGPVELAEATNIDVTNTGGISRRSGYTNVAVGSFRCLHRNGNTLFAVRNNELVSFTRFFESFQSFGAVSSSAMVFANVGSRTYYSNGRESGYIVAGTSFPWSVGTYTGPETVRYFEGPPLATLLLYMNGQMFAAVGSNIYSSEKFNVHLWDLATSRIPFTSNVVLLASAGNVLYVSDEEAIYAHIFTNGIWQRTLIHDAPAIAGSAQRCYNFQQLGDGLLLTTRTGVCFAGNDGRFIQLMEKRITLPNLLKGASTLTKTHYIINAW